MHPNDIRRMLLNHARMIALLCVSAVVHVVLITYVLNEKYAASTLVLITPQPEVAFARPSSEKELLNFPVSPVGVSMQTETSTKTYGALITSRPVIERVVRTLHLDKPEDTDGGAAVSARFRRLKNSVKEMLTNASQILKYGRVLASDPFDKAASDLSERITVAPTRNSYVFAIDCVWTDAQLAADIANETARAFVDLLSDLSKSEAQGVRQFVERRLQEREAELAEARRVLREFKERNHSVAFEEETAQSVKLITKLEGSLETVQSRLSGLLDQLTAENPKVANLQAQRDWLKESIGRRKNDLLQLPAAEAQLATLTLNVKTAEQLYELLVREYEDARLREAKRTSDIRVVAPALVPVRPVRPIKIYYAGVALLMALMVGVGVAFALEVTNTRLRNIDQVQMALGVPVLATVPDMAIVKRQ